MSTVDWNPWHGCTKISSGCKNCYVYRIDKSRGILIDSSLCRKNGDFDLPIRKNRNGEYKIPSGSTIYTCFQSDFLLKDADKWRMECFEMMKERCDCYFIFFTKRIDRFLEIIPPDWFDGYENVVVGCTVENQDRANYRLPLFLSAPIKHKIIIVEPFLESIDIKDYLDSSIEEVCAGGESGENARDLNYDWVLNLRNQCIEKDIPFSFHQTGTHFIKDGFKYYVKRINQHSFARSLNINFKKVRRKKLNKLPGDSKQLSLDLFD